jgi:hypothetical protein
LSLVNVDQFFGIEINEFPARIAETALWMMDLSVVGVFETSEAVT